MWDSAIPGRNGPRGATCGTCLFGRRRASTGSMDGNIAGRRSSLERPAWLGLLVRWTDDTEPERDRDEEPDEGGAENQVILSLQHERASLNGRNRGMRRVRPWGPTRTVHGLQTGSDSFETVEWPRHCQRLTGMPDSERDADVLVVGAGMAGVTAAAELQRAGRRVLVLDKGRAVGGRLASRRVGAATFDHGAQFITARMPRFAALIEQCREAGVVEEWCRGFAD
jgi:NAD(P)-binding Rossmann-like domain